MVSLKGEAEMPKVLNFASGRKVLITSFSLISQREREKEGLERKREGGDVWHSLQGSYFPEEGSCVSTVIRLLTTLLKIDQGLNNAIVCASPF